MTGKDEATRGSELQAATAADGSGSACVDAVAGPVLPSASFFANASFRPLERLRKRREFLHVQTRGRKTNGPRLVIIAAPGAYAWTRIGVTVSKKVGNSPVRSQVKRWLREAFRLHKQAMPVGVDIVLVARSAAATAGYHALCEDLLRWARTYRPPGQAQNRQTDRSVRPHTAQVSTGQPPEGTP